MFVTTQTSQYCWRVTPNSTQKFSAHSAPLNSNESFPAKQLPFESNDRKYLGQADNYTVSSFPIDESYIELAVSVCKSQTLSSLQSLKDFLTVLANPISIEKVLLRAVYRLADIHPPACRWLLSDPSYLMPELDIIEFTNQLALAILQEKSINLDAIALLDRSPKQLSHQQQNELWQEILNCALNLSSCAGDRLLLEATLNSTQKFHGCCSD